ncbi:MAG: hypothetical protein ACK47O_11835 [Betaproteobacteria bacterium]
MACRGSREGVTSCPPSKIHSTNTLLCVYSKNE